MTRLDLDRIRRARESIDPVFLDSPQYENPTLGEALGCSVTLKVETLNPVRSFKARGTDTVLARLAEDGGVPGVVCASAGNLGQALAHSAARRAGAGPGAPTRGGPGGRRTGGCRAWGAPARGPSGRRGRPARPGAACRSPWSPPAPPARSRSSACAPWARTSGWWATISR